MLEILTGWRSIAAAAAAGALLATATTWTAQAWRYGAQVAAMQRDQAQQLADAQALARATEHARWAAREGVINDARTQAAAAAADADTARAAADRLRQQVATLQRRARDTAAAGGGQTAGDIVGLLSKLFGDADEAAGVLAKDLDASRIAGLACESSYDRVRQTQ